MHDACGAQRVDQVRAGIPPVQPAGPKKVQSEAKLVCRALNLHRMGALTFA